MSSHNPPPIPHKPAPPMFFMKVDSADVVCVFVFLLLENVFPLYTPIHIFTPVIGLVPLICCWIRAKMSKLGVHLVISPHIYIQISILDHWFSTWGP